MRKIFESRIDKDEHYYDDLLKNATIVLDTNVLLGLYRLSEPTRNYFLSILDDIKARLWIPSQVGNEFFTNRLSIISDQIKSYAEFKTGLTNTQNKLNHRKSHPFLSDKTYSKLELALKDVYKDLDNSKKNYEELFNNDVILAKILALYDNRVGEEYDEKELEDAILIAKERYSKKIPPGYMDFKKNGAGKGDENLFGYEKCRPYGDYILWKQTISFAKEHSSVILVTDDVKEDWYQEAHGRTIGPRHELISEFKKETGKEIHFYQSDIFLERMEKILGKNINKKAADEIKASSGNVEENIDWEVFFDSTSKDSSIVDANNLFIKKRNSMMNRMNGIRRELFEKKHNLTIQNDTGILAKELSIHLLQLQDELLMVNKEINDLMIQGEFIESDEIEEEIIKLQNRKLKIMDDLKTLNISKNKLI